MKDERSNPEATCSRLPFGVYSWLLQRTGLGKRPRPSFAGPCPSTTRHLAQFVLVYRQLIPSLCRRRRADAGQTARHALFNPFPSRYISFLLPEH
jgi:hypothetical protein